MKKVVYNIILTMRASHCLLNKTYWIFWQHNQCMFGNPTQHKSNIKSPPLLIRHYDLTSPINQLQWLKNPSKGQKLSLDYNQIKCFKVLVYPTLNNGSVPNEIALCIQLLHHQLMKMFCYLEFFLLNLTVNTSGSERAKSRNHQCYTCIIGFQSFYFLSKIVEALNLNYAKLY